MADVVRLGRKGEIHLSRQTRQALELKEGDELIVSVDNDTIVLRRKATRFGSYLENLSELVGRGKKE